MTADVRLKFKYCERAEGFQNLRRQSKSNTEPTKNCNAYNPGGERQRGLGRESAGMEPATEVVRLRTVLRSGGMV